MARYESATIPDTCLRYQSLSRDSQNITGQFLNSCFKVSQEVQVQDYSVRTVLINNLWDWSGYLRKKHHELYIGYYNAQRYTTYGAPWFVTATLQSGIPYYIHYQRKVKADLWLIQETQEVNFIPIIFIKKCWNYLVFIFMATDCLTYRENLLQNIYQCQLLCGSSQIHNCTNVYVRVYIESA